MRDSFGNQKYELFDSNTVSPLISLHLSFTYIKQSIDAGIAHGTTVGLSNTSNTRYTVAQAVSAILPIP